MGVWIVIFKLRQNELTSLLFLHDLIVGGQINNCREKFTAV